MIKSIDFTTLKNIFGEMRQKSGVGAESDFVSAEGVVIDKDTGSESAGVYRPGKVYLNPIRIAKNGFTSREDFARKLLSVLVHEETHASGENKGCAGAVADGIKQLRSYFTSKFVETEHTGFSRKGYNKGNFHLKAYCFNEAATDLIAEDVYKEYLRRTGEQKNFTRAGGNKEYFESYEGGRFFLNVFQEKISQVCNVPYEKVREAMTQGYMSGLDIGQTELASLFDDIFYPGCIAAVEKIWHGDAYLPLVDVLKTVDFDRLDAGGAERLKNSFKKFASARG